MTRTLVHGAGRMTGSVLAQLPVFENPATTPPVTGSGWTEGVVEPIVASRWSGHRVHIVRQVLLVPVKF